MEISLDARREPVNGSGENTAAANRSAGKPFFFYAIRAWTFFVYLLIVPVLPLALLYTVSRWLASVVRLSGQQCPLLSLKSRPAKPGRRRR